MKDKEKQIEEILKLDILDCAGIKLAYLDDMRISKSKPLSVMDNILSIDCRKDYILEALGIPKDNVVNTPTIQCETYSQNDMVALSREEYEWLTCCFEKFEEIMNDIKKLANKETAEKILKLVDNKLDLYRNGVIGGSLYDSGYQSAIYDVKRTIKEQFGLR